MSQSEADASDEEDGVETCRMASEAAHEKGFSFCETEEGRLNYLARFVGLDADDVDVESALSAPSSVENREWVVARAVEITTGPEDNPIEAINQAWDELPDDAEQGPDHDDEEIEEPESDGGPEEEAAEADEEEDDFEDDAEGGDDGGGD